MNVTIELSLNQFDTFAMKCERARQDSIILKNAVMVRYARGDHFERNMLMRCSFEEASKLLSLAKQHYPDAVPVIEESVRIARF